MVARHARRKRAPAAGAVSATAQQETRSRSWFAHFGMSVAITMAAVIVAHSGAISAPFQFDDVGSVVANRTIDRLWPASTPLHPPPGVAVSGRPVANYSLAVDRAVNDALGVDQRPDPYGENKTVSFHVTNLLLHLACGLLLLGVLRRTLRTPAVPPEWRSSGDGIAFAVTVLWLLHPIQTEVVDYVIQRTESLVSLCYLATMYASIRAWDARSRDATLTWCALAVLACAVGMGSKEVMITAPVMVVLYDRAFRLGSWRALLDRRGGRPWLYVALAATAIVAAVTFARGARSATVGFHLGVTWYQYLYSQGWAIAHYLRLAFWPDQLTYDYGRDPIVGPRGVPGSIVMILLAIATVLAWRRASILGFAGLWFFVLLAPSSSIVPIRTEIAAERRIYLALASVIAVAVIAAEEMRRRTEGLPTAQRRRWHWIVGIALAIAYFSMCSVAASRLAQTLSGGSAGFVSKLLIRALIGIAAGFLGWQVVFGKRRRVVFVVLAGAMAIATYSRARTYDDPERLWRGAVANVPANPRAYDNLAAVILRQSPPRADEAERLYSQAITIDSTYLPAWRNLATLVAEQGRLAEAQSLLERLLAIDSTYVDALERLGAVLVAMGRADRGLPYLERADNAAPSAETSVSLGTAYASLGRPDDAASAFRRALQLDPTRTDALVFLGSVLTEQGRATDALPSLEEAVRRQPEVGYAFAVLALAYAQVGRGNEAIDAVNSAVARSNGDPAVLLLCGRALLALNRPVDAERYLAEAVRLAPTDAEAITRYGMAELQLGKGAEAEELFRRALAVRPDFAPAQHGLDLVRSGRPR